jgi:hypothetical protein
MESILKWTESKIGRMDDIVSKAFNVSTEDELTLKSFANDEVAKIHEEMRALRSITSLQLKDYQEKCQAQNEIYKNTITSLESDIKQLTEENMLLKERLRNADTKQERLIKENEELSSNLEKELDITELNNNSDESQYQINLLSEKVKRQTTLLKAERLKTVDAIREKEEIAQINELERKTFESKFLMIQAELDKEREKNAEIKAQQDLKLKHGVLNDNQNLTALSEHLQAKQRIIESLISEKSSLVQLLENEV